MGFQPTNFHMVDQRMKKEILVVAANKQVSSHTAMGAYLLTEKGVRQINSNPKVLTGHDKALPYTVFELCLVTTIFFKIGKNFRRTFLSPSMIS